jgi:hypothetical protein
LFAGDSGLLNRDFRGSELAERINHSRTRSNFHLPVLNPFNILRF